MNRGVQITTRIAVLAMLLAALPQFAWAHAQIGMADGFTTGFLHPISGLDHVVAMVAVGLWGAQLGAPAIWVLPITFPLIMAFGGMLGVLGVPLYGVEIGIALSAIALGGVVAFNLRPPLWAAMVLVGIFAIFHGHAHGTELPEAAHPLAYGVGFVLATGLLHLTGILIGIAIARPLGARAVRACGLGIALIGGYFLIDALGGAA